MALKTCRILHAQGRELVDIEEPAVVDRFGRYSPVREAVRLRLEQIVQAAPLRRHVALLVDRRHARLDIAADLDVRAREARKPRAVQALVAHALRASLVREVVARRQITECRQQTLEGQQPFVAGGYSAFERIEVGLEDSRVIRRVDGAAMLEVRDGERPEGAVELEHDLAAIEDVAVVVTQDRQQHLAAQLVLQGSPIDVEEVRVFRTGSVLEHVEPPAVVGGRHRHVVGDDVEELSHAVPA